MQQLRFSSNGTRCSWDNETEALALKCVREEHGSFYDACTKKCMNDVYFVSLSQDLSLEHVFPFLVLLVVVSNVLVALVLSQKHMITPTNLVLKYMHNYEREHLLELWWCYGFKLSMDALPPIFHQTAMWLNVLLAGQRFISIEYPLRSRELCSVRNVRIATAVITVFSLLCGFPKAIDFYYELYDGWAFMEPGGWQHFRRCTSGFTWIVLAIGPNTFFNIYFWTRAFGFILIPSLLLTILNVLLDSRHSESAEAKRSSPEKRAREAQRQMDNNSTSIMLVMIVSIFLIVNLPQAIFIALLSISSTLGVQSELFQGTFPATFMLISNMLVMATYPINFGIYCFMSSSYRKRWRSRLASQGGNSGSAAFSRLSVRRSDPSVSVQLSGRHSSEAAPPENSGVYPTVVRQENAEITRSKNDTVFL
ncbi:G-PROTEIN-RECEP-F1-2 domain-containing protein [Aphelenchoides fujianensis]|nr:G-PROTEIN-RECEP-F1-2 domain-containing protein [Aphelenchoides fujianensis]